MESQHDTAVRQPGGFYPFGFGKELAAIFKLAWPTSLSILFHYMIQPISLAFCGHLGKTELASVALAISIIYVTTISFGRGLAFGGDTFFSQTYGSTNKKKCGVYLQKALILGALVYMFNAAILLNVDKILLLIGQRPDIANMAQEYILLFIPGGLAYYWLFTLMRYMLCQNRVLPNLLICVVSCAICALLNYGLIYQAEMGIRGSAIALAITYYLVLFLLFAYIWGSGMYKETWGGWTWECLLEWGEFSKVVTSSIFMTFIFWLCTEVGTFLAGLLDERSIGAFSIQFQIEGFAWMVPLGIGGACTARIGQYLGANQPLGAITACRVSLTVQVFVSIVMAGLAYLLRYKIPMAFTSNADLVSYTASIIPIVAIFLLLEGFGGVGVSIVRGTGRQTLGVLILFVSWYVFSLPTGIPLMFATSLGLSGLWWGYVLGLAVQNIFLLIFVLKLNWQKEADKAQVRAGVITSVESVNTERILASRPTAETAADERTRLLSAPLADVVISPTESYEHFEDEVPWGRIIASRLAVLLFFVLTLVAGFLIRNYVTIPIALSDLCIPVGNVTSAPPTYDVMTHAQMKWNTTLPFCNETSYDRPVLALWF